MGGSEDGDSTSFNYPGGCLKGSWRATEGCCCDGTSIRESVLFFLLASLGEILSRCSFIKGMWNSSLSVLLKAFFFFFAQRRFRSLRQDAMNKTWLLAFLGSPR
ncbi:hypothetical protein CDAR_194861 [Caerostris darwini]|uniref:Uncharacterized protein n=1 Tax=Caerostris darwini TaxID=1538125 RepID=A0AAV4X5J0_9ARAC|nr:hypothetical protein CDAR_194861 [Caerostris darwini]